MYVEKSGLKIARELAAFLDDKVLPATGIDPSKFWTGVADIFERFTPENKALLAKRDQLQTKIDAWHQSRVGHPIDAKAEQKFLTEIGYLVDEPSTFAITSKNIDPEISAIAGPQLVVPVLNARFVLNAANARWGSLYDALYGTDVIPGKAEGKGYDSKRGQKVIAWSKAFLDRTAPIVRGSHSEVSQYVVIEGQLQPTLKDASQFAGYRGEASNPSTILLKNSGLHIEIDIDRGHTIGRDDLAGIADIKLEAALSTIVDMEDSVAAVDAEDKVEAYSNWFGLMQGDLEARFQKGGHVVKRSMNSDRNYVAPDGSDLTLTGRSLLLVRNVGHLMTTPAVLMPDGSEAFEGILDGILTSLISLCDLDRKGEYVNSRAGSIYIVKPKMHGPEEVGFANRLFAAVENLLGLDQDTIKIGVMDEERRTSANLTACIKEVAGRIFFINTGFLDRTGDEIHTVMQAGPVVLKENMKNTPWIGAYEDRNVQIGLACGFTGKAQIGKGMWAAPDRMAEMMEQKIAHPKTGANTAWVPSPTAATLHATHYHKVDVFAHRKRIETKPVPSLETLLTIPLAGPEKWSEADIIRCLENNIQSILGYVVRWIDQGIGCSKVPDYDDIGLMEDRATLRISSQHVANWLLHGVCTTDQVDAAFLRMAAKVDQQNAGDPVYRNLATQPDDSIAFQAAKALVFEGVSQPNGYTEPLLHAFRRKRKELDETGRE